MGNSVGPDHGWRILDVVPGGPADNLDLLVYFDFLVGVNGHRLDMDDPQSLFRTVKAFEGRELLMTFYNYKTEKTRTHTIIPKGGMHSLGLMICNDSFNAQDESIIKVKKIDQGSPAARAGLEVGEIVLCTTARVLKSIEIFRMLLDASRGETCGFWVYNCERCDLRMVDIDIPEQGRIGCQVSEGIMHNIPTPFKDISFYEPPKIDSPSAEEMPDPLKQLEEAQQFFRQNIGEPAEYPVIRPHPKPPEIDLAHPYVNATLGYLDVPEVTIDGTVESQILAADCAWTQDDPARAQLLLDEIHPKDEWSQRYKVALCALIQGDLPRAFEAYSIIDDVFAVERSVNIAFWRGDYAGMLASAEKLENKTTTHPYAAGILGFTLCMQGEYRNAEELILESMSCGLNDAWAIHALAHALQFQGRARDAYELLDSNKDEITKCGSYMRNHTAFHKCICLVDMEESEVLYDVIEKQLWGSFPPCQKADYFKSASLLNVLWKADIREVEVRNSQNYIAEALDFLKKFIPTKHKVAALCILRWRKDYLMKVLSKVDESDDVVKGVAKAVYAAYHGNGWEDAYNLIQPVAHRLRSLGSSPEQLEVIHEFYGLCLLSKQDPKQIALWMKQHKRPNVKFYSKFSIALEELKARQHF